MSIKKTMGAFALALSTLFTASAFAEKPVLDVVVASSNTGSTWKQSVLIQEGLQALGYDSEIIHTANCPNTLDYMTKDTGRPAMFLYSDGRYISDKQKGCDISVTEDSFVTNFVVKLQTLCTRSDTNFTSIEDFLKGKTRVLVATSNTLPGDPYAELSKQFGVEFVRVDYDGSSKQIAGLLSGDTDLHYARYTSKEKDNPEVKCFTTSAASEIDGLPPMKNLFPGWKFAELGSYQYLHGINMTAEQKEDAKNAIIKIQKDHAPLNKYLAKGSMVGAETLENAGQGMQAFLNNVAVRKAMIE